MLRRLSSAENYIESGTASLIELPHDRIDRAVELHRRTVKHVGDVSSLDMPPQAFDQIEVGTVRRQPEDLQPARDRGQVSHHLLCFVEGGAVTDQDDPAPGLTGSLDQASYQVIETLKSLGAPDLINDLPRREVKGTVDNPLLVLTRTLHSRLPTSRGPYGSEVGVEVELRFVLIPEFVGGSCLESPFFRASSRVLA